MVKISDTKARIALLKEQHQYVCVSGSALKVFVLSKVLILVGNRIRNIIILLNLFFDTYFKTKRQYVLMVMTMNMKY